MLLLHSKSKSKDDNQIHLQRQLEDSSKTILRLTSSLKEIESQHERVRNELSSINSNYQRDIRNREKSFEELEKYISDKEREWKITLEQFDRITIEKEKLYEDNTKMFNEIEHLKNKTYKLNQNINLVIKV